MASKFAGLFGGASPGDIRSLMEQENQARVRQAFLDQTKAGGGPLAANAARYREQGLQGLDRMLGAGAGMMGMEIPQDPRMVRASKREKDKNEILRTLDSYITNDGVMSEEEIRQGWSLLMSRGYQNEAKEFRAMAEGMLKNKYALKGQTTKSIGSGDTVYLSAEEAKEHGLPEKATYAKFIPVIEGNKVVIKVKAMPGKPTAMSDRDDPDKQSASLATQTGKEIPKRGTLKYKENLKRVTARLQQGLDIGKDKAKMYADWAITSQKETLKASNVAQRSIRKVEDMLIYIRELKAAGTKQGAITAALNKVGRAFGIEAKNKGSFRTRARLLLIRDLRKLMGARPTDLDLKKMEEAYPGEEQPVETNEAILEEILSRYREEIFAGNFYRDNPKGTPTEFSKAVRERFTKIGSYNNPLTVPDGKDFDEWYNGLPRGAIVRTPDGRIAGRK